MARTFAETIAASVQHEHDSKVAIAKIQASLRELQDRVDASRERLMETRQFVWRVSHPQDA